jgi:hypothetical protein
MSSRLIPERIRDFLLQRPGRRYCDSCIQERLGLRWRQQVQLVTATLAVTQSFARDRSICCTCLEEKHVIEAIRMPAGQEPSASQTDGPALSDAPSRDIKFVLALRAR